MREIRAAEWKALRELLWPGDGTEDLSNNPEEMGKRIEEALEKPDVEAVLVFPPHRHRRFPIPPKKTRI